jgi:hypothetical protein
VTFAAQWAVGEVFLMTMAFFLFMLWIWLMVRIAIAVFANHNMGGGVKALWIASLIIFPIVSVIAYLCVHGSGAVGGSMGGLAPSDDALERQMRAAH